MKPPYALMISQINCIVADFLLFVCIIAWIDGMSFNDNVLFNETGDENEI